MSQESACPTRQQLDELEALMQRMLSLPVSEGEEALPAPTPAQSEPKGRPTVLPPRLRAIPDPPPWDDQGPANSVPPPAPPIVSAPPPGPRSMARPPAEVRKPKPAVRSANPEDEPVVHSERVSIEAMPPAYEAPSMQTETPPAERTIMPPRARARVVRQRPLTASEPWDLWWLTPLVWSNQAFDRCTLHLGQSGRWLRGARGRAWIGWSGIFFFALAVAWALLEWLGLTW